jgi:dipeptidyl aminopeptidase/acylaminoacyl peptidase
LRGGVDVSGIADFVSFSDQYRTLPAEPAARGIRRRKRPGDAQLFTAHLRLTNADRITRPLLVVHGKNDPRVPVSEAEQIVNKVRAKGGEVWYLLAADEGHGYRKKQNRDAYYETFAQFLMMLRN